MGKEDEWEKQLAKGAERMTAIEGTLSGLSGLVKTADGFIKATRIIVVLFGALLALYGWILNEKNNDFKAIQSVVQAMTVQNAESLAVLRSLVIAQEKDGARLERHIDSVGNGRVTH